MPLTEFQQEYLRNCSHRWNIKTGATRSGKTYLDCAVTIPKRICAARGEGLLVLMGNTLGTLERNVLSPMRELWGSELVGQIRTAAAGNVVQLFGQKVYVLGADNKKHISRIQGAAFEYVYGDEITTWDEGVFQMLKSRLSCPHSHFDGTCNPENPQHWFKKFLDSDADIYCQAYTIDDNPTLPAKFVADLKQEYAGTVYYNRFILGQWMAANGVIYRLLADSIAAGDGRFFWPAGKELTPWRVRIRLTCILLGGGRFWLMPEAATLRDALATALYSGKHPGVDERLDDGTTFQIKDAATARYLLGDDEQQVGGLLRDLHFWQNANKLVEQAYWSGTGAFVLSAENLTLRNGTAVPGPETRLRLDYDPASCILPLKVERGIVTEAAFVSECMMDGKPAVYLQTHTGNEQRRTIRNEWFRVTDPVSGIPEYTRLEQPPEGTVESITVEGSPPWFSLFSPAAVKNIDGGTGLGQSIFAEALAEAQGIDLAFDNYREDIRLGHKKIFYSADLCRKVIDKNGVEHSIPPDDDVVSQFVTLPEKAGSLDQASEYHEYNPDLRVEANHKAVQDMLNLFSFKCGLLPRYKYLAARYGVSEEDARKLAEEAANENRQPELSFGGV